MKKFIQMKRLPVLFLIIISLFLLLGCIPVFEYTEGMGTKDSAAIAQETKQFRIETQGQIDQTLQSETEIPIMDLSQSPQTVCQNPDGRIESYVLENNAIPKPIKIQVCLPPCFDEKNEGIDDYPVLYMLHGQSYDDEQWIRMGLCETAADWILKEDIKPFLIVLPHEEYGLVSPADSFFEDALLSVVIPWIDARYQTCTTRDCRAIGGVSRGGGWAFHVGYPNWELFGAIGCHSVPPFVSDFNVLPFWFEEIPEEQLPALYLDIGDQDRFHQETLRFHEVLEYYQVPHEWFENQGGHDEDYWTAQIDAYLRWYIQLWEE
ncbi:MAG: hypothetical protein JEZ06_03095 [Anaerolineaceae bacterium]|nr:hypothetical protein [Anaerolineaceae bacterium]